ncbi:MAG: hypothetical protein JWL70_386, partial [Acidimicrobiia bacterium]|nr:hypothetical protein [Acidimicrobiia bacterium]
STASSIVGKQITWLGTDGKSQTGIASSASLTSGTTVLTVGTTKVPITAVQEIAPAPAPVVPPAVPPAAVVPPAPVDQSS